MGCLHVSQNTSLTNSVYLNDLFGLSVCVTEYQSYQQCLCNLNDLYGFSVWVTEHQSY